jgi:2-keto-3-deoxy-L-rhamnonate aldolase RhmA
MKWIRQRIRSGEFLGGTFLNLGSSLTAEMAGLAGFDWVVIDLEHGSGDHQNLLLQLQALSGTTAVPLVRVAWNDAVLCKRVLDLGPAGVMVPWINSKEEAKRAAAAVRYPPQGVRGVAAMNRACGFGLNFDDYFRSANDEITMIAQIETGLAVDNVREIASLDGVDVLFIGPLDLSVSLGIAKQFDHPGMRKARAEVVAACREFGKAAGILLSTESQIDETIAEGFTFVGMGSDGAAAASGLAKIASTLKKSKLGSARP